MTSADQIKINEASVLETFKKENNKINLTFCPNKTLTEKPRAPLPAPVEISSKGAAPRDWYGDMSRARVWSARISAAHATPPCPL